MRSHCWYKCCTAVCRQVMERAVTAFVSEWMSGSCEVTVDKESSRVTLHTAVL